MTGLESSVASIGRSTRDSKEIEAAGVRDTMRLSSLVAVNGVSQWGQSMGSEYTN